MAAFDGLGKALRWLRARQDRRQYQVADAAGVTKAMLSAYETGKQKPSLETLEKILDGLGASLGELYQALLIVNGQSDPLGGEASLHRPGTLEVAGTIGFDVDLYRILGIRDPLPVEEEYAMRQMLVGFHGFLRFMHNELARSTRPGGVDGTEPAS